MIGTFSFNKSIVVLAALFAALGLALAAGPNSAAAAQCTNASARPAELSKKQAEKALLCLINKERSSRGLHELSNQADERKAAAKHTKLMIRERCFSHECPGEADLVSRLAQSDYLPCTCSWGVGENLAYGEQTQGAPRQIMDAWMHSTEHRDNILNGRYEHIGIGIVWGTPTVGGERGSATYTTDFGYRD